MMGAIKGWKTITSCLVIGVVAVLQYLGVIDAGNAQMIYKLAEAFGIYGVYDRVKNQT